MLDKLLLLGLCLVGGLHAAPEEPAKCEDICKSKYSGSELEGCGSGCRLMNVEEAMFSRYRNLESIKQSCDSLCKSSHGPSDEVVGACTQGCEFMIPTIKSRHQRLRDPFESFFGNGQLFNQIHLPQIFPFAQSRSESEAVVSNSDSSGKDEIPSIFNNFGNVMSNMHRIMNSVMERFRNGEFGGNGKLVVIKAGPGHYETKTYNLSPKSNMNDMMNKVNPLDDFFNPKKQKLTHEEKESGEKDDDQDPFGVEFVKPIKSNEEKENEWDIEPILPETGLKSRIVHDGDVCNRHPEYMTWSNYFYCVDKRISSSGWWIYICILPLACLLLLRICMLMAKRETETLVPLTITSHKDVLAKAKEAEANASVISIVTIPDYEKGDLPPAYEDITNLKVSLVPQNKDSKEKVSEEGEDKNETKA